MEPWSWPVFLSGVAASVVAGFILAALFKWRDRGSAILEARRARKREQQRQRSERKQALFEYRCRLAEEDPTNRLMMLQWGMDMHARASASRDSAYTNVLIANAGFLLVWMSGAPVSVRVFTSMVFGMALIISGVETTKALGAMREAFEFLDPAYRTLPVTHRPLIRQDTALSNFEIPDSRSASG